MPLLARPLSRRVSQFYGTNKPLLIPFKASGNRSHLKYRAARQRRRVAQAERLRPELFIRHLPCLAVETLSSSFYLHSGIFDQIAAPVFFFDGRRRGIESAVEIDQPEVYRTRRTRAPSNGGKLADKDRSVVESHCRSI